MMDVILFSKQKETEQIHLLRLFLLLRIPCNRADIPAVTDFFAFYTRKAQPPFSNTGKRAPVSVNPVICRSSLPIMKST